MEFAAHFDQSTCDVGVGCVLSVLLCYLGEAGLVLCVSEVAGYNVYGDNDATSFPKCQQMRRQDHNTVTNQNSVMP